MFDMILTTLVFVFTSSSSYSTIFRLDPKRLCDNSYLWGPFARICNTLLHPDQVKDHKLRVSSAVEEFTNNCQFFVVEVMMASHRLFVIRPRHKSRRFPTVTFASDYILGFVPRVSDKHNHAKRLTFYNVMTRKSWFATLARRLLWFCFSPATDFLQWTRVVVGSASLEIPACTGYLCERT